MEYEFNQERKAWFCVCPFLLVDPCKYFGCELGAQTQMDAKNNRYIVNGAHEGSKLQAMLDGFIKKFVLCPECENPETDLVSLARGEILAPWLAFTLRDRFKLGILC